MDHPAIHFGTVLLAFFGVMNPLANAPIFIGLTQDLPAQVRKRIATQAVLVAFLIVTAFALGGLALLNMFQITLPAFRIAGGIVMGLVGYHMLQGAQSRMHTPGDDDLDSAQDAAMSIAISPLALPILAGPGTVVTAMNFASDGGIGPSIRVIGAFAVMCLLTWFVFVAGQKIVALVGASAIGVISRLMGLLLTAIGVQMVMEGVGEAVTAAQAAPPDTVALLALSLISAATGLPTS
ncbi:MAG: MarC family protein [Planctomycetota bacterium]